MSAEIVSGESLQPETPGVPLLAGKVEWVMSTTWKGTLMRLFRCVSLFTIALAPGFASAQEKKAEVPEFTLGKCIEVAIDRQPSLKAVRASQDSTAIGRQALHNIGPLGSLLSRDLPVRKMQADRGLTAAEADVLKTYNEVVHDVTRLYCSVIYARHQARHLDDVTFQIETFAGGAKSLLDSPAPGEMTKAKYETMLLAVAKVRRLRGKAQTGVKQAEAALREAMGVSDGSLPFTVKDFVKEGKHTDETRKGDPLSLWPLMDLDLKLTKEQVVELALSGRPEITMAQAGTDAIRLEACAQDRILFRRKVPTLASGADLHARIFPSGSRASRSDYRPEPIMPEMPAMVVGRRSERVARVQALGVRAEAVQEKVRNLITLEAENAFFDYEDAVKNLAISREAGETANELIKRIKDSFENPKAAKEQLIQGYAQAAEAVADYNSAAFQYLLELAALERITAGGVRPQFPGR